MAQSSRDKWLAAAVRKWIFHGVYYAHPLIEKLLNLLKDGIFKAINHPSLPVFLGGLHLQMMKLAVHHLTTKKIIVEIQGGWLAPPFLYYKPWFKQGSLQNA